MICNACDIVMQLVCSAEKGFHDLVVRSSDPDWQIGCRWYELLNKYGFAYTRYRENYAMNLRSFPLSGRTTEHSDD